MPIPESDANGLLPPGVHECTLEEIGERFGRFESTDRRITLFAKLKDFFAELRSAGLAEAVVVDGSFVTAKPDPDDIDIVLVLPAVHDYAAELRPFEYRLLSRARARKTWGFDVLVAPAGSEVYEVYVAFFQQVKGSPSESKGILMVRP